MKNKVLWLMSIMAIIGLTACGNKPEIKEEPKVEPSGEPVVISETVEEPKNSEEKIVKASLIDGGEWKPSTGYVFVSGDGTIEEYDITDIYGKYAGVGGIVFHQDYTFTKFIGIFDGEEEADKNGTYSISAETHTITFQFSRGDIVIVEYDYTNEGEVMYFIYPEGDISVRFDPSNNISLKDNITEAKYQIENAMKKQIKLLYGKKIVDSNFTIEKIYSLSDEQEIEALKEKNLNRNEIAFEVKYEIKPAEDADIDALTATNGVYDEESGWIKEKYNLGILRPSDSKNTDYMITDFGTGW